MTIEDDGCGLTAIAPRETALGETDGAKPLRSSHVLATTDSQACAVMVAGVRSPSVPST